MRQLARLEYDGREWVLLMDLKDDVPKRRWTARETALAELADEGWTVAGPYP